MIDKFYPKGKVLFSVFPSYPRYAGPREAVFTAICRKNYGCTHFIVGRDHSGVGNYYGPLEARDLFKSLKGIGIEPIFFDNVYFNKKENVYMEADGEGENLLSISGTRVRESFLEGKKPEDWLMREEISLMIEDQIKNKGRVFTE